MCLVNFAYKVHPQFDLVVAANRDEFFARETAPAYFWEDHPNVLAGRDLEQGGTWLGVTKDGKFAALTNYREMVKYNNVHSRGKLVLNYLVGSMTPEAYLLHIQKNKQQYAGFNLLVGNKDELYYYSNKQDVITSVPPGIHSISNAFLNTPWPKVKKGKEMMEQSCSLDRTAMTHYLLEGLDNRDQAEESLLPKTGVPLEKEKQLSPMFIRMGEYGTRSSTIVKISKSNDVIFHERTYDIDYISPKDRLFEFKIDKKGIV